MAHKLLLIEDEKNFGMVLKDYLSLQGYDVTLCENGELGVETFKKESFDLCILDIMMPKKDGFSVAEEMRLFNKQIPFIFLTARGMRDDVIKGYRLGAYDYITKPFDSEVLLYKLKIILDRVHSENILQNEYKIGKYFFNAKMRILKKENQTEIKLSPKEAALLQLLCQHLNDVLPREKALKQIWKEDNYFTARSMDVYIVKLRKHFSGDNSIEINNLHGNGYTLLSR